MLLSVPLFVSAEDVIERMQLESSLSGLTEVVSNAIMGAELHIESLINSTLVRTTQNSVYYLDSDAFSGMQPNGVFRLEVPSGLIRKDTPVIIRYSETAQQDLFGIAGGTYGNFFGDTDGPFGEFELGDSRYSHIDYDKGYILLEASRYCNRYVQVSCDTGFEPGTTPLPVGAIPGYDSSLSYDPGDRVSYQGLVWTATMETQGNLPGVNATWNKAFVPMEPIPPNLYEAILSIVPSIFDSSQIANRSQEAEPQYRKGEEHALLLLNSYIRMSGFSFRPMW